MADPTQILRFLEARFGAEVPNVCAWRRATVGDLTSSFNIAVPTIQFRSCRPPLRQFRRSSSNVRQIWPAPRPIRCRIRKACGRKKLAHRIDQVIAAKRFADLTFRYNPQAKGAQVYALL
jgi:phospholipase C